MMTGYHLKNKYHKESVSGTVIIMVHKVLNR